MLAGFQLALLSGCNALQQKLLFYPSHHDRANGLTAWVSEGKIVGCCRPVSGPKNIWLLLPGNGGQAADRAYAMPCFARQDAVFVLEYPGYGAREGEPSRRSHSRTRRFPGPKYRLLRKTFPATPVCVAGESLGSGPAAFLANQPQPPDKIVLVVPFDTLASVAAEHYPFAPVSLILK